ncbi:40S ribosomal protein S17 [Anaeramoeba flamelloides]|uniref:40S ribosomal protein S17 n=1 Tax=Anaeramoeba flamelloides TaxID=1746091 RepID=A0AAV7Z5I3_9EUKA|nr:40S ribosomal protein S17 [Anaeramoeba flamelloides]KAJ3437389.1 40S ribosomal protein S17 [Anaeramoeba flamelloides]KAJ3442513.1 40S ribosomal protein S17 [Anaeramoeba flamelloides]KAJ3452983.1 40S ribosomal protein S17 [Anaeramoeba flamelloides]KAJ6227789.1 40S ribosomal protein S17 [Anaeramoeba flamelloides]|eukprot:Anaeramoba_flamelloidesc41917_g1_i3.p1 GENE.c41917_g1_i3~~c41917_g1_i3.p1  ORF type:complete len:150 (+),score=44.51 c41917_g1_i3:34-483(+)
MGRVRTKTVKRAARLIVEKYYTKLTIDFQVNKKICSEVASIPTKRLRNKIAGYVTHLMKRIERGPVPGISIKLQEEEKERRDNWVPEKSYVEKDFVYVDKVTKKMIGELKIFGDNTKFQVRTYNRRRGGYQKKRFPRKNNNYNKQNQKK